MPLLVMDMGGEGGGFLYNQKKRKGGEEEYPSSSSGSPRAPPAHNFSGKFPKVRSSVRRRRVLRRERGRGRERALDRKGKKEKEECKKTRVGSSIFCGCPS